MGSSQSRHAYLDGLESPDAEVRRLAVEQLSLLPIEEAQTHLDARIGDSDWRVRKAVVARLEPHLARTSVQDILVESLADGEDPGRRNSAFEALVKGGVQVVPRLTRELSSPDVDVRKLLVDALAEIGDPKARPALVSMTEDEDPNVRSAAVEALGVVGGSNEINRLLEIVRDHEEDVLVRLSSLRALTRMEIRVGLSSVGSAIDASILRPSVFALFAYSEDNDAIRALLKGLEGANRSGREAAMASLLRQLGRLDDVEASSLRDSIREIARSTPALVKEACERLETIHPEGQIAITQFLGLVEASGAVGPLLKLSATETMQSLAMGTLESLGDRVPTALDDEWDELEADAQCAACGVLGRIGGAHAERLLAAALDSQDFEIRCAAATGLGAGAFFERLPELLLALERAAQSLEVESAEEVSVLVRAIARMAEQAESEGEDIGQKIVDALAIRLGGAAEPVRLAIAQVLSKVGQPRDREVIEYLAKDESPEVRRAALGAFGHFEFDEARESLRLALGDETVIVRTAAARVLGEMSDPEAADELLRMLADGDARFLAVVLRSLGRFYSGEGDTTAKTGLPEILRQMAFHLDGRPMVALAATEALAEVGGRAAADLLGPALHRSEPEVVRSAVTGIGRHGDEGSLPDLLSAVGHPEWSVRAEAARALGERNFRKGLPVLLRRLEIEDDAFVREALLYAVDRLEG